MALEKHAESKQAARKLEDAYPLSALQAGMIFHSEFAPDSPVYHDIVSVQMEAPFDHAALSQVMQLLAERHPVLRTSFDLVNFSEPMQLVRRVVTIPLVVEDWCHLSQGEQEEALAAWMQREKRNAFDWTSPPLIRAFAHQLSVSCFQLSLSFHHAILDGWSLATLLTELSHAYSHALGLEREPLPPPPTARFRDCVNLERQALKAAEPLAFWQSKLEGASSGKLPRWISPSGVKAASEHRVHAVPIPVELSEGLKRLAASLGVPLKSVLLAAHVRVLGLISGDAAPVTGLVANCRPEVEGGDRTLGLFLNTVPLRVPLAGGTWTELIQATFAAEQELLPFRRYPLSELQRRLGGQPLFESAFNFTHFHVYQDARSVTRMGRRRFFEQTSFPLGTSFALDSATSALWLSLQYYWPEFTEDQVARLGHYYTKVVGSMTAGPMQRYEGVSLLSPEEQHQMLVAWNWTQWAAPGPQCLHDLFAEQVERAPDAVAVWYEDQQITYRELNNRANRLALYLRTQGVGADVPVGICVERSPEMVVGLLAVLKAGGAYVPLDPEYPRERVAYMLHDSNVALVLTQRHLLDLLTDSSARVVCLDVLPEDLEGASTENPASDVTPDSLAYVIYTSGSTGQPKGAMVQHRAICNRLAWTQAAYGLTAADRILQKTAFSFDVSVGEVLSPLICGGTVVLAKPGGQLDTRYLVDLCARAGVTTVYGVPSWLQAFMEEDGFQSNRWLKRAISGGEELSHELEAEFYARLGRTDVTLYNEYGPTEAAITVSYLECGPNTDRRRAAIGRPIANTQLYVLDENLQPLPVGVPGELFIGGVNVGRGYLGRPDLTADRFVPDLYGGPPGARLYRTGDLTRWLPDGQIEFLGRIDSQVKVRGYRIELGEIEAVLRTHSEVHEAVVTAYEDAPGKKRLVAYIVPCTQSMPAPEELRRHARTRLPDYMLPTSWRFLDQLPLNPNGKVDRRALPAPGPDNQGQLSLVAPRSEIEHELVAIWQDVLSQSPIGVMDNFFDLGGDSIAGLRLISRIRKRFDKDVPLGVLFEGGTIAQLASVIESDQQYGYRALVPLHTGGTKSPLFLVHPLGGHVFCYTQFAQQFGTDRPLYALQARGFREGEDPFPSIEEMAAHYVREVTDFQPQGPYHLGGWCLGGTVAFEMARQLTARGEDVAQVVVISSSVLQSHPDFAPAMANDDTRLLMHIFGHNLPLSVDELRKLSPDEQLALIFAEAKTANVLRSDIQSLDQARRLIQIYKAHAGASLRYAWPAYSGPVVLFKGEEDHLPDTPQGDMGWGLVAPIDLQVRVVPGNHYTILVQPNVAIMSQQIRALMDDK
jgi:amino acid adenylation domain-containing protein